MIAVYYRGLCVQVCVPSATVAGDVIDNDCDGSIDEEVLNNVGESAFVWIVHCVFVIKSSTEEQMGKFYSAFIDTK